MNISILSDEQEVNLAGSMQEYLQKETRKLGKKLMKAISQLHEMYRQDHALSERIMREIRIEDAGNHTQKSGAGTLEQSTVFGQSFEEEEDAFGQRVLTPQEAAYYNQMLIKKTLTRELLSWAADSNDRETFSQTLKICSCRMTVFRMLPTWAYPPQQTCRDEGPLERDWFAITASSKEFVPGAYITEKVEYLEQILEHDENVVKARLPEEFMNHEWDMDSYSMDERELRSILVLMRVDGVRLLVRIWDAGFGLFRKEILSKSDYEIPAIVGRDMALSEYFGSRKRERDDSSRPVNVEICSEAIPQRTDAWMHYVDTHPVVTKECENRIGLLLTIISQAGTCNLNADQYRLFLDRWLEEITKQGRSLPPAGHVLNAGGRCSEILVRHYLDSDEFRRIRITTILTYRNEWFLKAWISERHMKKASLDSILVRWEEKIIVNGISVGSSARDCAWYKRVIARLSGFYQTLFHNIHSEKARNTARRMLVSDIAGLVSLRQDFMHMMKCPEQKEETETDGDIRELLLRYCMVPDYSIYIEKGMRIDASGIQDLYDDEEGTASRNLLSVLELFWKNQAGQPPYPVDLYADVFQRQPEEEAEGLSKTRTQEVNTQLTLLRPLRIEARPDPVNLSILRFGSVKQIKSAVRKGFLTQENAPAFLTIQVPGGLPYEKKVLLMQLCGERQSIFHMLRV